MMSRIRTLSSFLVLVGLTLSPHLAAEANVIMTLKITDVLVHSDGFTYVETNIDEDDYGNCEPKDGQYIKINLNDPNGPLILELAHMYRLNQKDIKIRTKGAQGDTGTCEVDYLTVFPQ